MIPLIWGIAALVGFALALAFGRTWRRTGALVLLGLVLAVAWLVVGYFMATAISLVTAPTATCTWGDGGSRDSRSSSSD